MSRLLAVLAGWKGYAAVALLCLNDVGDGVAVALIALGAPDRFFPRSRMKASAPN